mmetsp:Transcript_77412/g.165951  ORF Transcript_77412/g.165951 Transcript_77412/m.165951 type:complete len:124 (+) Transcript_77412:84-455(+)
MAAADGWSLNMQGKLMKTAAEAAAHEKACMDVVANPIFDGETEVMFLGKNSYVPRLVAASSAPKGVSASGDKVAVRPNYSDPMMPNRPHFKNIGKKKIMEDPTGPFNTVSFSDASSAPGFLGV